MVIVTVLKSFYDLVEKVDRFRGERFEATEERAAYIAACLPEFIEYSAEPEPEPVEEQETSQDLSKLTVAQLKAICSERGIEVPKGAKKAEIVALLEV